MMDDAPHQIQTPAQPITSGMAIASLVCGILGCLVLPALLGIIFGIIAIRQIDSSGGALTGKCLAVGGLVVSGLMCIILIFTPPGASLTGYIMLKKVDEVMEGIRSASVLTVDDQSVTVDDHNKTDDDNGTAADGNADAATKGGDGHGGGDSARGNPPEKDNPEELVPIVDAAEKAAANHSVVANPKGTQGKRYIVVEVYMQRSEPKDTKFKERAGKNTKRLQEIVTRELESKTVEDLQNPITREYIKRTLQNKFNAVLQGDGFHTPVGKIVFSKWIMQ